LQVELYIFTEKRSCEHVTGPSVWTRSGSCQSICDSHQRWRLKVPTDLPPSAVMIKHHLSFTHDNDTFKLMVSSPKLVQQLTVVVSAGYPKRNTCKEHVK